MALSLSLTYDGTSIDHLETVLPHLTRHGLRGTFYADSVNLLERLNQWREAAADGNEIGNGCLGASALPDGSLPAWTTAMILDEVEESDRLLIETFPMQGGHSLGLPWGPASCADDQPYLDSLTRHYEVIRTGETGQNRADTPDFRRLHCFMLADMDGSDLISILRLAMQKGGWAIMAFEGVGSGERSVDAKSHLQLCQFIEANRDLVDVRPVIATARHLATRLSKTGHWLT